jgi:CrcB protein
MNCLFVFIGGGVGAMLRYATTELVRSIVNTKFSLGILVANCTGALIIGFLSGVFGNVPLDNKWRLLLIIGFVGGYTTFSGFLLETIQLYLNGQIKLALVNFLSNNVLCLLFVLIGMWLYKTIMK